MADYFEGQDEQSLRQLVSVSARVSVFLNVVVPAGPVQLLCNKLRLGRNVSCLKLAAISLWLPAPS